jgi:uncharacterized membrane protein
MGISVRLKDSKLIAFSALLGLGILGCAMLYGLRVLISGRLYYLYLVQNILLAFVPYLISVTSALVLSRLQKGRRKALLALPCALLWLLFYPNAPYIFTDFIHVVNRVYLRVAPADWVGINALIWYDLVMTAAFAFIGHFIGLVSMWVMQSVIAQAWGRAAARVLVGLAIVLAGLGIYLGRFSRLNSWDAVLSPFRVASELIDAFSEPMAALFCLGFALFILLSYGALASFKSISLPASGEPEAGAR